MHDLISKIRYGLLADFPPYYTLRLPTFIKKKIGMNTAENFDLAYGIE